MLRFRIGGKAVEHVDLLRRKDRAWRLDLLPFAFLYGLWAVVIVTSIDFGDALIVLGGLIALHTLVWLFTAWSVDFKCFTQFSKVDDIRKADACKVTPAKFSGSKEVVPLLFRKLPASSSSSEIGEIYFDFRKQRFIFSEENKTFSKLPYPTKDTFGYYVKNTGHGSDAKVFAATEKWGRNVYISIFNC